MGARLRGPPRRAPLHRDDGRRYGLRSGRGRAARHAGQLHRARSPCRPALPPCRPAPPDRRRGRPPRLTPASEGRTVPQRAATLSLSRAVPGAQAPSHDVHAFRRVASGAVAAPSGTPGPVGRTVPTRPTFPGPTVPPNWRTHVATRTGDIRPDRSSVSSCACFDSTAHGDETEIHWHAHRPAAGAQGP